jgi:hypothetical protein
MAPHGTLYIEGLDRLSRRLSARGDHMLRAGAAALYREGELMMTEAKLLTPVDKGALHNSGFAHPPERVSWGYLVTIGFGGPAAPYALIVHEDLEAAHTVGQAKYLETAVLRALPGLAERIARELDV